MTGTCVEPIMVKMSDTTFGLVKDSQLIVMRTVAGSVNKNQIIKLHSTPYAIGESLTLPRTVWTSWILRTKILNRIFVNVLAYDEPYLVVGFGDTLCVQTTEPYDGNHAVRQEITTNFKILKISCCKNGLIYAMSAMSIWWLKPVPRDVQIERLLEEKNFRLAIKLAVSYIIIGEY